MIGASFGFDVSGAALGSPEAFDFGACNTATLSSARSDSIFLNL
jgi:hypothetical protein